MDFSSVAVTADTVDRVRAGIVQLQRAVRQYEEAVQDAGRYDYDDLASNAQQRMQGLPDTGAHQAIREAIVDALCDQFVEDTTHDQEECGPPRCDVDDDCWARNNLDRSCGGVYLNVKGMDRAYCDVCFHNDCGWQNQQDVKDCVDEVQRIMHSELLERLGWHGYAPELRARYKEVNDEAEFDAYVEACYTAALAIGDTHMLNQFKTHRPPRKRARNT